MQVVILVMTFHDFVFELEKNGFAYCNYSMKQILERPLGSSSDGHGPSLRADFGAVLEMLKVRFVGVKTSYSKTPHYMLNIYQ